MELNFLFLQSTFVDKLCMGQTLVNCYDCYKLEMSDTISVLKGPLRELGGQECRPVITLQCELNLDSEREAVRVLELPSLLWLTQAVGR